MMQPHPHQPPHQYPQHPYVAHPGVAAPTTPQGKSHLGLILGIIGGLFLLLVIGAGTAGYLLREKKHDRQANAWSFDLDERGGGDSINIDIHGTPFDAKVTVQGRTTECSILCHVTLERKDLKPGEKKVTVALDWKGRHVEKTKERPLIQPRVTFASSPLEKRARQCDLTTNEQSRIGSRFEYVVPTDDGITLKTKGAPGDTVSINQESPIEPGTEGHTHSVSHAALLKLLTLGPERDGGIRSVLMKIPIAVKSSDGVGWSGDLSCSGDMIRYYVEKELKAARLGDVAASSSSSSGSPKAGALVLGGDPYSMFYVGEGAKPFDAKLAVVMSRQEILSKDCTYGNDWDHKFYFYHWYAHDAEAVDLRAPQTSRAKRRFAPTMTGFVCPTIARFSAGESSRSEDISPKASDEAAWIRTLL